jgi:hypothetical protein
LYTLPVSVQETIRASQLVENSATKAAAMDLGPTRSVSIGEVLIWKSLYSNKVVADIMERLNPNGFAAFTIWNTAVSRHICWRINHLKKKTMDMIGGNRSIDDYTTESLVAYFKADAISHFMKPHRLLELKNKGQKAR